MADTLTMDTAGTVTTAPAVTDIALAADQGMSAARGGGDKANYSSSMKTHGPVVSRLTLWFTMLSPIIGLIVSVLGAWIVD